MFVSVFSLSVHSLLLVLTLILIFPASGKGFYLVQVLKKLKSLRDDDAGSDDESICAKEAVGELKEALSRKIKSEFALDLKKL